MCATLTIGYPGSDSEGFDSENKWSTFTCCPNTASQSLCFGTQLHEVPTTCAPGGMRAHLKTFHMVLGSQASTSDLFGIPYTDYCPREV
jgi:hypothetical protein